MLTRNELEGMLQWSAPQTFTAAGRGQRTVRTAIPTNAFWGLWRSRKNEIKALEASPILDSSNQWIVKWYGSVDDKSTVPVHQAIEQIGHQYDVLMSRSVEYGKPIMTAQQTAKSTMRWSDEQEAIFAWFRNGGGSMIVRARAGTGKTTTIKHAFSQATEERMLYAVFNKKNQVEAVRSISDPRVDIKTLHSLGFLFIGQVWPNVKPTDEVESDRVEAACGKNTPREVLTQVKKLVGFAKNTVLSPSLEDMVEIADIRMIECPQFESEINGGWTATKLSQAALKVLELSKERDAQGRISFNDMVWLPVVMGWVRSWYDLVVCDECFPGDTHVLLADGTSLPIGQIVENRTPVNVLSFDEQTGQQVVKPVIDFKKVVLRKKTYRVKVQQIVQGINGPWNVTRSRIQLGGRTIVCTEGHKIWTTRGWVCVENLREGDHVQVESKTPEIATMLKSQGCPTDAIVMAVEEHEIDDTFVYDLTVADTHCYYANGVLVHNCQDMSLPQLLMVKAACKQDGRVCVVGDDRQAIYGFRGAASDGMDMMKQSLNAQELGLTITYRCPKSVVALANMYVKDYRAADTAPEGLVETVGHINAVKLQVGDAVLSRSNSPLMPLCLSLLRRGVPARIEGRDIGKMLLGIVEKLNARTVPQFITKIEAWDEKQKSRFMDSKHFEEKCLEINDQVSTLMAVAEGASGVNEIKERLSTLFTDSDNDSRPSVVLSSVHRAKGLEWQRVAILSSTFFRKAPANSAPLPVAVAAARAKEEENIYYVALTRSKNNLFMVTNHTNE